MVAVDVEVAVVVAVDVTVEVEVTVAFEVMTDVTVVVGEAVQVPAKLTPALLPGLREPRLLTSSIWNEPVAGWLLGSEVRSAGGMAQVAFTTAPKGRRCKTSPWPKLTVTKPPTSP